MCPRDASRTTGAVPGLATLTDNGDGTGSLTGTPPAGSGGTYTVHAHGGQRLQPGGQPVFTLTVTRRRPSPARNHATFTVGQRRVVRRHDHRGFPTATAITETGALPSGVTFTDNGDGTATLAGTPAAGTAGSYPITITATPPAARPAPATQTLHADRARAAG